MSEYQIVITRANSFYGCAVKHSVEVDGFFVGVLTNGKTLTINTAAGSHTISFISRGKLEKTISISIGPEDYMMRIFAKLNGRQKLEITMGGCASSNVACIEESPLPKKKRHPVLRGICIVFGILIVLGTIGSIMGPTDSDTSSGSELGGSQVEELTDEEKAMAQLENASTKFQDEDYISAIELCDQIISDYPNTETAANIGAYLEEQYSKFTHISAKDLMSEYDANIVNADETYTDTVMVVTGTVNSIGKTNHDKNLTVILDSGTYFYGVQLNFKTSQTDSVASLREGDKVSAIGKCTGKSGKQLIVLDGNNVMIENCYLITE